MNRTVSRSAHRTVRPLALIAAAATMLAAPAFAAPPSMQSYIVVLHPGTGSVPAVAAAMAHEVGGRVGFVYEDALEGFSITAPAAAMKGLARNPRVDFVEVDRVWSISAQDVPTGIARAFAAANPNIGIDGVDDLRVDVDVAVIDTGIDRQHTDLNVVAGINCAQGNLFRATCSGDGDDDHFHGTHVAGTIGALDNGTGVVGMAPGARLHAVKVLNSQGSGYTSWIVAGINWVAARASDIEVANMSLGGAGYSQAEYTAIQGAVNKGVAFAVAAGNDDADANGFSPGGFDNVLSVSALADFNGLAGGGAAPTCRTDVDDTLADFSNWGPEVDVAAPGVCILSTYPIEKGEYGTISGTSMASPHVAGALALLASNANASDATGVGDLYSAVTSKGNFIWTDDSGDAKQEPLLDVSTFVPALVPGGGGSEPPAPPITLTSQATSTGKTTWKATATLSGPEGTRTSGMWDYKSTPGGCTIAVGATTCTFSLSKIPKSTWPFVTYTDTPNGLTTTASLTPLP